MIAQSEKGNKSGNWMTDSFNSVANLWAHMIAFHRLSIQCTNRTATHREWRRDVTLFTLGDDAVLSVNDNTLTWYNPRNIADVMYNLGFTYTSADKAGLKESGRSLDELTFLKSRFVPCGDIVLAPMPKYVSFKELNWCKKGLRGDVEVRHCMIQDAVTFAAHHGEEYYNQFKAEIVAALHREVALSVRRPILPTWQTHMLDLWTKQMEARLHDKRFHTY
jgi:hypothetical protein